MGVVGAVYTLDVLLLLHLAWCSFCSWWAMLLHVYVGNAYIADLPTKCAVLLSFQVWCLILMFCAGIRYIEENDYPVRGTYGFSQATAGSGQGY